jgi:hypothetical protein
MARKKKKKQKKIRVPKVNYQRPLSQIRPLRMRGPRYYLKNARSYPFLGCWKFADLEDAGIGPVVIARKQSENRVLFGVYLLDIWCLGIKDAFVRTDVSLAKFQKELPRLCSDLPQEISIEFAHELIYGAKEYAEKYGFQPHPDFTRQMADQVLDPPDAYPRTHNIEFGKEGKPHFVAGPYDDEQRCRHILNTLERTAGPKNYSFIVHFGTPPADIFE